MTSVTSVWYAGRYQVAHRPGHRCRAVDRRTYAALVPEQPITTDGRPPQRHLEPVDPPTVPFAIGGMVLWAIAGLVLLLFRHTLSAHGHTDWLWICLAGFLWGFPGWYVMVRHDRHRAARRAARNDQEPSSVG